MGAAASVKIMSLLLQNLSQPVSVRLKLSSGVTLEAQAAAENPLPFWPFRMRQNKRSLAARRRAGKKLQSGSVLMDSEILAMPGQELPPEKTAGLVFVFQDFVLFSAFDRGEKTSPLELMQKAKAARQAVR